MDAVVAVAIRRAIDELQKIPVELRSPLVCSVIERLEDEACGDRCVTSDSDRRVGIAVLPQVAGADLVVDSGTQLKRRSACRRGVMVGNKASEVSAAAVAAEAAPATEDRSIETAAISLEAAMAAASAATIPRTQDPQPGRDLVAKKTLLRAVTWQRTCGRHLRMPPTQPIAESPHKDDTDLLEQPNTSKVAFTETTDASTTTPPQPRFVAISNDIPLSRILFRAHDIDDSGGISSKEFKTLVYSMGYYLTDTEVAIAFAKLDTSGTGEITYTEFLTWWSGDKRFEKMQLTMEQADAAQRASEFFQYFDTDEKGYVDRSQFWAMFHHLRSYFPEHVTPDQAMAQVNRKASGVAGNDDHVSFNNYISWLLRIGSIKTS